MSGPEFELIDEYAKPGKRRALIKRKGEIVGLLVESNKGNWSICTAGILVGCKWHSGYVSLEDAWGRFDAYLRANPTPLDLVELLAKSLEALIQFEPEFVGPDAYSWSRAKKSAEEALAKARGVA